MTASRCLGLIAAHDRRRVIGYQGGIPWHHPVDLKHFRETTLDHAVIMGRSTHRELGKPLTRRHNLVVTHDAGYEAPGCHVVSSLPAALELAYALDPCPFIIGGATLYTQTLPLVTVMYLTLIPGEHPGDTFFPEYGDGFEISAQRVQDGLTFLTLRRRAEHSG